MSERVGRNQIRISTNCRIEHVVFQEDGRGHSKSRSTSQKPFHPVPRCFHTHTHTPNFKTKLITVFWGHVSEDYLLKPPSCRFFPVTCQTCSWVLLLPFGATFKKTSRWAPTGYKCSYNPYKWHYTWVTRIITSLSGVITPLITGRGAHLLTNSHAMFRILASVVFGKGIFDGKKNAQNRHLDGSQVWMSQQFLGSKVRISGLFHPNIPHV